MRAHGVVWCQHYISIVSNEILGYFRHCNDVTKAYSYIKIKSSNIFSVETNWNLFVFWIIFRGKEYQ